MVLVSPLAPTPVDLFCCQTQPPPFPAEGPPPRWGPTVVFLLRGSPASTPRTMFKSRSLPPATVLLRVWSPLMTMSLFFLPLGVLPSPAWCPPPSSLLLPQKGSHPGTLPLKWKSPIKLACFPPRHFLSPPLPFLSKYPSHPSIHGGLSPRAFALVYSIISIF